MTVMQTWGQNQILRVSGNELLSDDDIMATDEQALNELDSEQEDNLDMFSDSGDPSDTNMSDAANVSSDEDVAPCHTSIDGRSYLIVHQVREKWENLFPFAYFTERKNGWLCKICEEYGKGNDFWSGKAVKHGEHPGKMFSQHRDSEKHKTALKQRAEVKAMLHKGSIYSQTVDSAESQSEKQKFRNRVVIKKFLKTAYFLARKKWAVRENFRDVVSFIRDLGDADFTAHLNQSSSRATYVSKFSTDEFIACLSDFLEEGLLGKLVAAQEFSLLADETTDIAARAELSVFLRYVDSDVHRVREEYLGLVEVVGPKGSAELFELICEMLKSKGVDISQMTFNGFDGTNSMSGCITGLQSRFRHLVTHCKYLNCRNHRLALVFVHLVPQIQALTDVDALILSVWKLFKKSSVKAAVFNQAQEAEGLDVVKLLKAALTRWLSYGQARQRLISRFEPLVNCLDSIINSSSCPVVSGVRDSLLTPNTILMLLLLTDILLQVNRFCRYLQTKNLIFATVARKFQQLLKSLEDITNNNGPNFNAHAEHFLAISQDRAALARQLRGSEFIEEN